MTFQAIPAGMPVVTNDGYGQFSVFVPMHEDLCRDLLSKFVAPEGLVSHRGIHVVDESLETGYLLLDVWRFSGFKVEYLGLGSHRSAFQGWGVSVAVYPVADELDHTLEATELGLDDVLLVASLVKRLFS